MKGTFFIFVASVVVLQHCDASYLSQKFDVYVDFVTDLIYGEERARGPLLCSCLSLPDFPTLERFLKSIARNNEHIVELRSIGTTHNQKEIPEVVITNSQGKSDKPVIVIDAMLHGDEENSLYIVANLIDQLLKPTAADLRNSFEFHILPVMNPDGYIAGTRKNGFNQGGDCVGVDLNRNFEEATQPDQQDPCSEDYSVHAFSEPETKGLKKVLLDNAKKLKAYISLHADEESYIVPASCSDQEDNEMNARALAVANALALSAKSENYNFTVKNPSELDVPVGNSVNFAHDNTDVPFAYVITYENTEANFTMMDSFWSLINALAREINPNFDEINQDSWSIWSLSKYFTK